MRSWRILLRGWSNEHILIQAETRSKARAEAYRRYYDDWQQIEFRAFLDMIVSLSACHPDRPALPAPPTKEPNPPSPADVAEMAALGLAT